MKTHRLFALFSNFDEVRKAILEIKAMDLKEGGIKFLRMNSPVPHPELEEVIGARPVYVQRFTLIGALTGALFGFLLAAWAQASFAVQPQGGKPVIPIPPDLVITFEFTVLFGVLSTLLGFFVGARLPSKGDALYSHKISTDQVGLLVEVPDPHYRRVKNILTRHKAREIMEETV